MPLTQPYTQQHTAPLNAEIVDSPAVKMCFKLLLFTLLILEISVKKEVFKSYSEMPLTQP